MLEQRLLAAACPDGSATGLSVIDAMLPACVDDQQGLAHSLMLAN
jgi:hypothetical protein